MAKFLDKDFFRFIGASERESLEDIGSDFEERDKIEYEVSKSFGPTSLDVDYSDFENHVFFGSAFWAVNFAIARIFNDQDGYPWDGTLKEKNEWRSLNTDFENWWYDNIYPKQVAYVNLSCSSNAGQSGSNGDGTFIQAIDDSGRIIPGTGSFTTELLINPNSAAGTANVLGFKEVLFTMGGTAAHGAGAYVSSSGDLIFRILSSSVVAEISSSFNSYRGKWTNFSFVYNSASMSQSIYANGEVIAEGSVSGTIGETINLDGGSFISIGAPTSTRDADTAFAAFSGAIGEFRYWKSARSEKQIKRNYYKQINANPSGGLLVYYKFNEFTDVLPIDKVIDYSGNGSHGDIRVYANSSAETASDVIGSLKISGSTAEWFQFKEDPIFNRTNTSVSSSISNWLASGSNYDRENRNLIFNIVPSQFIDEENHEDMQLFLLLIARHYDRLKLYIQHLSNVLYSNFEEYDNAPDELLDMVAKNYGLDISDVYSSKDPLQYYFGENILSTGSLNTSLQQIRNRLRRNLVNNLIYVIKTKSARESLVASLRSLGLDDNIVNINEYSRYSGSVQTFEYPKFVERRVLRLDTGSAALLHSASWSKAVEPRSYQFRVLFNSSSLETTSSVFSVNSGSIPILSLTAERENPSSSLGKAVYSLSSSDGTLFTVTSSLLSIFDDDWVSFNIYKPSLSGGNDLSEMQLNVSRFFRDEIKFSYFTSSTINDDVFNGREVGEFDEIFTASVGTSNGVNFDGYIHEVRVWDFPVTSSLLIDRYTKDFDSLNLKDFVTNINSLKIHHKMNDFTGSTTGEIELHDYSGNDFDGVFSGSSISSSAVYNFPGKHHYKLEQSVFYDFGVNNNKIRIKSGSVFTENDVTEDIPYVSVEVSPINSLNREIIKRYGELEKVQDIIGFPYVRYQHHVSDFNTERESFFSNRVNGRIDYRAFLDLVKWLDSSFVFFFEQLIPLDMASSVGAFSIEPHIFEYNKIEYPFPYKQDKKSKVLEASASVLVNPTAVHGKRIGDDVDPGRFGSAVSASAQITDDIRNDYSLSSSGVNYSNLTEKAVLRSNNTGSFNGYSGPYYSISITGSESLKNLYNVNKDFVIRGIRFWNDGYGAGSASLGYLSMSTGQPINTFYTASFNGYQDQRWLYVTRMGADLPNDGALDAGIDFGIKHGGAFGQLRYNGYKSVFSAPDSVFVLQGAAAPNEPTVWTNGVQPSSPQQLRNVEAFSSDVDGFKSVVLWPNKDSWNGTDLLILSGTTVFTSSFGKSRQNAASFGDPIDIAGYNTLNLTVRQQLVDNLSGSSGSGYEVLLAYKINFQFWDDEYPGDIQHETYISSSLPASGGRITNTISNEVEYLLSGKNFKQDTHNAGSSQTLSFERKIPQNKFMRIRVTPIYAQAVGTANVKYKVLIKGRLAKSEVDAQNLAIKKIDI